LHRVQRRFFPQPEPLRTFNLSQEGLSDHVVAVGYGRTGRTAVEVMRQTGLPHIVIDSDHSRVADCIAAGRPTIWGDATLPSVLDAADLSRARLLLLTIPDPAGIRTIVRQAREIRPDVVIVARATYREQLEELDALGVYEAVQPEFEAGLEMVRQVLARYDYSPADILRFSDAVHRDLYGPFRARQDPGHGLAALEDLRRATRSMDIEWITLGAGWALVGRTLTEMRLRSTTGASVVALRDSTGLHPNPSPEHIFREGDTLGILGTIEQRAAARAAIAG
jgi:CPA2 family monovalent cation:H+ antiporter-2